MFQELHEELHQIHRKVNLIMIDLAKLNSAEQAAAAKIAALKAEVTDLQAKLAVAGDSAADQAAVDAVADKINQDAA